MKGALLVIFGMILVYFCVDKYEQQQVQSVPEAQETKPVQEPPAPEPKSNEQVQNEYYAHHVYRFKDDKYKVICWRVMDTNRAALSCLPEHLVNERTE